MQGIVWILSVAVLLLVALILLLFVRSRKAAEKIKQLEHTAMLIESAPYYIAYDDNEKSDLYANAEACRMVGRPVGKPMTKESTHDEKGMRILLEEGFPAVKKHGTWVGENQLLHSDGH